MANTLSNSSISTQEEKSEQPKFKTIIRSYDIDLAIEYGRDEAILIHHFQYWIRFNKKLKRNIKDGKCWTYQSRKEIQAHFPEFTFEEIRNLCEDLVKKGVLITANYNKNSIDKTLWYAFKDEEAFGITENSTKVYERAADLTRGQPTTPIPYSLTTNIKEKEIDKEKNPPTPKGEPQIFLSFGLLVKLTEKQKESLDKEFTKERIDSVIDDINLHYGALGKCKYKDFYLVIRKWIKKDDQWKKSSSPFSENIKKNTETMNKNLQKNPTYYRNLRFNDKFLWNTSVPGKELSFNLPPDNFFEQFKNLFDPNKNS